MKKARITLQSVINHVLEISHIDMQSKGRGLKVEAPQKSYAIDADYEQLAGAIFSLLANAAKPISNQGNIILRVSVEGKKVIFSVKDDGAGLEDPSSWILNPSTQAPEHEIAPAELSLGLAEQVAEMHGGTLHASREERGRATEFILVLPIIATENQLATELEKASGANAAAASRKILLVDDNVDAVDTLQELLRMNGFEVTAVYDGMAAVASARTAKPDVVVMDIGMPGMDGYDAARLIRQQEGGSGITLIALTGWDQPADRQRVSDAGFDAHLIKPVDYRMLMKCLQD